MAPMNLLDLKSNEFKEFLDSFDYVFSDCDGVIWYNTPYAGSGDFFKLMQKHGKTAHFVSNNSTRSKENYVNKFKASGIENGFENLTTPSRAIVEYLKSVNFNKKIYCVTCHETKKMLELNGFVCESGPEKIVTDYFEIIQHLEDDETIGAVVFDGDMGVTMAKLYRAKTYLMRPDCLFLNGAADRYLPMKAGQMDLGVGVFTDLVTEQVKRNPIQLGKSGKEFGEIAMRNAGAIDPNRVLFIGDSIDQDVGLGKATGFKTLLVLTTLSKDDMIAHPVKPDYYAPSLGILVPLL